MTRRLPVAFLVGLLGLLAGCGGGETGGRPNVILISIDTLRPDHLGCYGYARPTSPRIDRLARDGVLFENHVSSTSWTLPAHAALFTSMIDSIHGCTDTDRKLHPDLKTLAERFREEGYATSGFFSGPYLHPAFGLGQGFDHYEDCTSYHAMTAEKPPAEWAMDRDVMRSSHRDVTNSAVIEAVTRWLRNHEEGEPFFLFVHLFDVHFDFIPPGPYDRMFDPEYTGTATGERFFHDPEVRYGMPQRDLDHIISLYDGEIAWTDDHVGVLLDTLKKRGVYDTSIIALTSDHGTEFFEHRGKAHRTTLFDELIRIPLILRFPPKLLGGVRIGAQSRMIDVGPTLLELAGIREPAEAMGASLVPLAVGAPGGGDRLAMSELFSVGRRIRSFRTLDWKHIDDRGKGYSFFFDLSVNPFEARPDSRWGSALGRTIQARETEALGALQKHGSSRMASSKDVPEAVRKQLEALGYLEGR